MERMIQCDDVIVTEYIGREGAARLASVEAARIREYFSPAFIRQLGGRTPVREPDTRTMIQKLEIIHETVQIVEPDAYFRVIGYGGIFTSLWDMAESTGRGMEIMIDKIPVKQETIELCELFRLNPYYLMSGEESVLIVCSKGSYLIQKLKEKGINASCIGFLTGNNDKVLRFGDHLRYLDRPREDEFLRYRKEKGKGNERVNFKGH